MKDERSKWKQPNLKPCPFCDGPAYLEKNQRGYARGGQSKFAYVRCLDCNARSAKYVLTDYGKTSHSKEAEQAATNHWNMRKR